MEDSMSSKFSAKKFWVAFILLATLGIALICGLYVYRVQSVQISLKQYELTESAKTHGNFSSKYCNLNPDNQSFNAEFEC